MDFQQTPGVGDVASLMTTAGDARTQTVVLNLGAR